MLLSSPILPPGALTGASVAAQRSGRRGSRGAGREPFRLGEASAARLAHRPDPGSLAAWGGAVTGRGAVWVEPSQGGEGRAGPEVDSAVLQVSTEAGAEGRVESD